VRGIFQPQPKDEKAKDDKAKGAKEEKAKDEKSKEDRGKGDKAPDATPAGSPLPLKQDSAIGAKPAK
jgi:hypothetical protein